MPKLSKSFWGCKKKSNKWNARKTIVDNITFHSKLEAKRYKQLKLLQMSGYIQGLKLQPKFLLQGGFRDNEGTWIRPIHYIADFDYMKNGQRVIEDAKGKQTAESKIKIKMFKKQNPELVFKLVTEDQM